MTFLKEMHPALTLESSLSPAFISASKLNVQQWKNINCGPSAFAAD